MMTLIASLFPTVAGWVNLAISWWKGREQAQKDQDTAVDQALDQHQNDGAQSTADQVSSDAQNAALDEKLKKIDEATPIVVVVKKPEAKP